MHFQTEQFFALDSQTKLKYKKGMIPLKHDARMEAWGDISGYHPPGSGKYVILV